MSDVYSAPPFEIVDGIPVFSRCGEYTDNYERIAADHLEAQRTMQVANPFIEDAIWHDMERSTAELLRRYSSPGDRVLDVGVGLGRMLGQIEGVDRYGMDISFGYLRSAQSNGIQVCYSLIEDMPYREHLFDAVVCTDVLEHVFDLNAALLKILRAVKTGGYLILRVPYREDLRKYLDPAMPYEYVHLRSFDEYSLRLLLQKVFKCQFVESCPAAYDPSTKTLRTAVRMPKLGGAINLLLRPLKTLSPALHRRLQQRYFYPIELNIVFRSPSSTPLS